jgi:hypothetical protein
MFYVDLNTGKLKTKLELLRDFANVSTPEKWGANTLATFGVAEVEDNSAPAFDVYTKAIPDSAEEYEEGKWRVVYRAEPIFQEYTDDDGVTHSVADQQAEYDAQQISKMSHEARAERNNLLKATDHFGLSDSSMSAEMTAYRQALRDVPQQEGFPEVITWPTKPE